MDSEWVPMLNLVLIVGIQLIYPIFNDFFPTKILSSKSNKANIYLLNAYLVVGTVLSFLTRLSYWCKANIIQLLLGFCYIHFSGKETKAL